MDIKLVSCGRSDDNEGVNENEATTEENLSEMSETESVFDNEIVSKEWSDNGDSGYG